MCRVCYIMYCVLCVVCVCRVCYIMYCVLCVVCVCRVCYIMYCVLCVVCVCRVCYIMYCVLCMCVYMHCGYDYCTVFLTLELSFTVNCFSPPSTILSANEQGVPSESYLREVQSSWGRGGRRLRRTNTRGRLGVSLTMQVCISE